MRRREWLLPLALGAVAATLVLVLPGPSLPHRDPLPEPVEEPLGLAWAFHDAVADAGTLAPFLAVGEPTADGLDLQCADGPRRVALHAESAVLWRADLPAGCRTLDGVLRVDVQTDPVAPRFGRDGRNATAATVYAFSADGELLASNAGATHRNRYHLYGDFVTISDTPWYLGDGPVPDGMRTPEGYAAVAHDGLEGLTVGAVATETIEHHEYDWLVGPVWVTVRLESLLEAP